MSAIDKDILDTMTDEEREILNSKEWKDDQEQAAKRPDLHEGDEGVEETDDDDDADDEPAEVVETPAAAPAAVVDAPAAEVEEESPVVETRKAV